MSFSILGVLRWRLGTHVRVLLLGLPSLFAFIFLVSLPFPFLPFRGGKGSRGLVDWGHLLLLLTF